MRPESRLHHGAYLRKKNWTDLGSEALVVLALRLALEEARCKDRSVRRRLRRRRMEAVALHLRTHGPFKFNWWFVQPYLPPPSRPDRFAKFPYNLMRHATTKG